MTKLTKHNSFKNLKLSSKQNATMGNNGVSQLLELEDFLNQLQQKLMKARKPKNDKF